MFCVIHAWAKDVLNSTSSWFIPQSQELRIIVQHMVWLWCSWTEQTEVYYIKDQVSLCVRSMGLTRRSSLICVNEGNDFKGWRNFVTTLKAMPCWKYGFAMIVVLTNVHQVIGGYVMWITTMCWWLIRFCDALERIGHVRDFHQSVATRCCQNSVKKMVR